MGIDKKPQDPILFGGFRPGILGVGNFAMNSNALNTFGHPPDNRIIQRAVNRDLGADGLGMQTGYCGDQVFFQLFIKICGICSRADLEQICALGPDAIGFNFWTKSSRYIRPEQMSGWLDCVPETVKKVGIFVEPAADEAEAVMYAALSKGVSFKLTMGNILTLTPALTISREEMDTALDIIEDCISEVE